ncbi:MAG: hypothetical protein VKQ33_13105 [Candidatus Sericytochromatia bacterium]|nr:hypothetical protein [Candidatus Sericytochromatia bacterium]
MRSAKLTSLALASWLGLAAAAFAVPVQVRVMSPLGPVQPGVPVVAFSYDIEKVFPGVQQRFERYRPAPPNPPSGFRPLPLLKPVKSFYLLQASELEGFRETFADIHRDEPETIAELKPLFNQVFKKHGDRASDSIRGLVNTEDGRELWVRKVVTDLNNVINAYNARNGVGEAIMKVYQARHAKWLGKRTEALRYEAERAGGNPTLNFVESLAGDGGIAAFDLPPGTWYVAAQSDTYSWYRAMRVTNTGGKITVPSTDASRRRLPLVDWVGM